MTDAPNYDDLFTAAGQAQNVDPRLLKTVYQLESTGGINTGQSMPNDPDSPIGGMQIRPSTIRGLGYADPTDMKQAIPAAAAYLRQGLDATGTPEGALSYYFGGPDQTLWKDKTANYVAKARTIYPAMRVADSSTPTPSSSVVDSSTSTPAPGETPAAAAGRKLLETAAPQPNESPGATAGRMLLESAPAAQTTPDPTEPSIADKLGAGLARGVHDMTDVPAELLAQGADKIGLTNWLASHGITGQGADQTVAADRNALAGYNTNYGGSSIAQGARIGTQIAATVPLLMTGEGIAGGGADVAGALAGRVSPAVGRVVGGVTDFLGGTGGGNALMRGGSLVANGALQGGAAGALSAGQDPTQSVGSQAVTGAALGAVAGPVGKGIAEGFKAATGLSGGVAPAIADLANTARTKYSIPIPAPLMSENSLVRAVNDQSSKMFFSGAGAQNQAIDEAWHQAVGRTMGEQGVTAFTPDVMARAATRIGGVLDDVATRTNINANDPQLLADLSRIETEANSGRVPLSAGGERSIRANIDGIIEAGAHGNGTIPGDVYQKMTQTGSPLDIAASRGNDIHTQNYNQQIMDALDNAFQRSASPQDQAALLQARDQYRVMKTIQPLAAASPDGTLSPATLMQRVTTQSNRFDGSNSGIAYTGGGDLGDLAKIGKQFLGKTPNSTTADRLLVNSLMMGGGGTLGALTVGNPWAAPVAGAVLGANRLLGMYLRGNGLADRLIQNSLNPAAAAARTGASKIATGAVIPTMRITPWSAQQDDQ